MPVSPFNVERFAAGRTGAAVPVAPLAQPLPGATAGEYVRASGYWDQVAALGQELAQTAQQVGTAELRSQAIASDLEAAALHRQNTMRLHQLRNSAYVELADMKDRIGNSPETPPEQIENIFSTQAAAIAERYRQELPPEMADGFASDFGRDIGMMRIDLRHKATARMESSARADLQSSLEALQGVAARASPEERERITGRVDDMIGAALRTGSVTPEEAHKAASSWIGGLDEALLRAAIQDDPEAAVQRIDAGEFRGLQPDHVQQLRGTALAEAEQRFRHREVLAERDRREVEDATYKSILDDAAAGKLNIARVQEQRDHLSVHQYEVALRLASPERQERTDSTTYLGLSRAMAAGVDVRDATDAAWAGGMLKREDRDRLWGEFEKQRDAGRKYGRDRAADLIGKPSLLTGEDAAHMLLKEQTRQAFSDWYDAEVEKGKVPTMPEIEAKSRQIGETFSQQIGVPPAEQIKGEWGTLKLEIGAFKGRRLPAEKALEFDARERRLRDWAQRRGVTLE